MRVLFINPAMERYTRQVSFPLGLMSIATYLKANGHTVKIIDRTIKTTNIKKEIAEKTKCCDSGYLCRIFKKKTGMTPGEYKFEAIKKQSN